MNTDCANKPYVAPKPTLVCPARMSLMSVARGPKPSVAPKPILKLHLREPLLSGIQEGCINGVHNGELGPNKEACDQDGVSSQTPNTSEKHQVHEEEMVPKMDEDWRLTDSALTDDVDSLDTLWASDDRLTTDSEDAVEMIDTTDVTEEMDEDAGEALADTDGLSMGDISVNSRDEEKEDRTENMSSRREQLDDTFEFFTDDLLSGPSQHASTPNGENYCKTLNGDHTIGKNLQLGLIEEDHPMQFSNQKRNCHEAKRHITLEESQSHEPYYVSPEDIIKTEIIPNHNKVFGAPGSPLSPQRQDTVYQKSQGQKGPVGYQRSRSVTSEEHKLDALLNRLYRQPKFRLLCNSDSSLTSSFVGNQLIVPRKLDFFRHALRDEVTDTDASNDHLYEDPGDDSSEGENVFPLGRSPSGMRSRSLSHRINSEAGERLVHAPSLGQKGPVLSSSPMLKGYPKPHYLPLYPPSSASTPVCAHRETEGSPCGRFSRCSPLSSSGLSTPTSVVDIPPPFELAYITKKPIAKSSPSLLIDVDPSEKNQKKKSSIKRFLMLKFKRKVETKPSNLSSSESSTESSHMTPNRLLDPDKHSVTNSPRQLHRSTCQPQASPETPPALLFYPTSTRTQSSVAFLNRSVVRVESFEERSRVPFSPLPLTKPRSISFPNADSSDYENVPPVNSDYENVQVPQWRPSRPLPLGDFFERPTRVLSSANETDGYVDMSSLPGFEIKVKSSVQEPESAYTEAYRVCPLAAGPQSSPDNAVNGPLAADDDAGRTSDEEDAGGESNYDRQVDGRSRAFYIAMDLLDTERAHVKALKLLQENFCDAVRTAVGDDGEPVIDEKILCEILNELPDVYLLHCTILTELENRTRRWEESQRIADIFLSRKAEFLLFTNYIGHYDRNMNLLDESSRTSPAFAAVVCQFEQSPSGQIVSLKQQLLQVIVRVAQYRMILTDYLNNLSPDSQEYEDTQAAVVIVADIADQANDSLQHGENLLRLVNIEYSVHGQRDLLHPGRVFVKEGTLMKVSRRSRQPRHLFLMNDILLYTYPQQDGKYRLKNTLSLTGLKVTKPIIENVQHALKVEGTDISITLSASSFIEREDWFYTLSHAVSEHNRGSVPVSNCFGEVNMFYSYSTSLKHTMNIVVNSLKCLCVQARDHQRVTLGEKPPTLVPVSQVMMCMNCTSDFSLTLRRHHCHSCGRIVCRSCSKNRFPLKYMKERMSKVCDHCFNELKKRGDDTCVLPAKSSPRVSRSTRPLSSVFQSIHPPNIWRHRKGMLTFNQVTVSDEGSISGSLHRSKKSKRNWKRLWFLLKDKVLYTYRGQEEKVASESLPLLGFTVKLPDNHQGDDASNMFQLYHKNTLYYTFKAEDNFTAQRWVNAMEEATVL
ncbi:FYVE, RhoGEF and PH domain-containing protein 5-like isoform X2 [Corythoichthys intestinalis]|uniref:FYVE, RhoGEF and PH domain-containing protein 5-like isoform X2 n=1 Tax=Corythoichthys intestinalis TaxID=161448 RepID=UPI0025A66382|nr:FYVE, RhoGEF and PH domain-containing protein 5-like isoform X2 [Corythoichthys intestinalis]